MEQKPKKAMQEFYLPSSILQDPTQEPLKVILTPYHGLTHIPADVGDGSAACMVFIELNKCFKKAGFVAEGMLGNIIWGFEQCGFHPNTVAGGLTKLRALGYIRYTDTGGMPIIDTDFNPKKIIWIRYEPKFTDLFIRSIISP
jgi:hypothetical protein